MQLSVLSLQILIVFSPQAEEQAIQVVDLCSHSATKPKKKDYSYEDAVDTIMYGRYGWSSHTYIDITCLNHLFLFFIE